MEFTTFEEFDESLRDEWNALLPESVSNVPFLQFDYLKMWWEHLGGGEWQATARLALITAREQDRLVGIAPLFIAENGDQRCLMFLGSIEISDFLDLIVREKDVKPFIHELLKYIQSIVAPKYSIARLDLYNLLEESPSVEFLQGAASELGWAVEKERLQRSPFIQLPGDWEAYLGSLEKKQRHEIRRKMRRASESEFPVDWHVVQNAAELEAASETFFSLMVQEKDKQKFLTPPMRAQMKALMQTMFNLGALQLAFLTVNGNPAVSFLNFDYNNRIWLYNSGLGVDYMDYSPGWVLMGHLLKWANENKREVFDFMRGDEEYKYRFGAKDRYIVRLKIDLTQFS